ncbi:MAG: hypothetical protein Q4D07_01075 [Selenomonadaceae bacterium]|nr:hypothetical protein [Selenomonadaceae bacterium]
MFKLSTATKIKLAAFGVFLLAVAAGGVYWYFGYHIKTADYAMKKIESSLKAHDANDFNHYYDKAAFVDKVTDDVSAGMLDDGSSLKGDMRSAVLEFVKIFRAPLKQSVEGMTNRFIRTGSFSGDDAADNIHIDSAMLIRRLGLDTVEYRGIKSVVNREENGEKYAVAKVEVYQKAVEAEFQLELVLVPDKEGTYRLNHISNLAEFFSLTAAKRHERIDNYLKQIDTLNEAHDKKVAAIEQQMSLTLASGNLGTPATREKLRLMAENDLLKDWQVRLAALEALNVPDEVQTLHNLYVKIAKENIEYAKEYAAWLVDKKGTTISSALNRQREAKTLTGEAAKIRKQIKSNEGF